jgi:hypothetical protein
MLSSEKYSNVPISLSLLHIKEYDNLVKNKVRNRRTSSERAIKSDTPKILYEFLPFTSLDILNTQRCATKV